MNKSDLLKKIKHEFPQLKFSQSKLNTYGFDHAVLILDNKYIFRFPKDKYYKKKIKIEIKLLDNLKNKTNVAIPNYEFVPKDKSFGGYKLIPGRILTKTAFNKLNKQAKKRLAKNLGNFLTVLHTFPVTTAKRIGLVSEWTIKDRIKDFNKRKKAVYSALTPKEKNLVRHFIKKWATLSVPKKFSVIHFDLTGDHILIHKNRLNGIIDFGDSALGDPANDFAWLWIYGDKFVYDVYNNYDNMKDEHLLLRSKYYYFATLLSSLYHGVVDKKQRQVTITLKNIRKELKNNRLLFKN